MTDYPADAQIVSQIETLRVALLDRVRSLIFEVAEWQQTLSKWQHLDLSPRLRAELRTLKATPGAWMDEANAAASGLSL